MPKQSCAYISLVVPFVYTLRTRLSSFPRIVGFFVIYLLPILDSLLSLQALAGFVSVYLLYELGYMQNDVESARSELSPALRAPKAMADLIDHQFNSIIFIRLVCIVPLIWFIALGREWIFLISLAIQCIALCFLFNLHNSLPTYRRMLTFFALNYLRYSIFYMIALSFSSDPLLTPLSWPGLFLVFAVHPSYSFFQKYYSPVAACFSGFLLLCISWTWLAIFSGHSMSSLLDIVLLTFFSLVLRSYFSFSRVRSE